jgi:hypothetical protein
MTNSKVRDSRDRSAARVDLNVRSECHSSFFVLPLFPLSISLSRARADDLAHLLDPQERVSGFFFVLKGENLSFYESEDDFLNAPDNPHTTIMLESSRIVASPQHRLRFIVTPVVWSRNSKFVKDGRAFHLEASHQQELDDWLHALER